jgi:hypothetical protein
MAVLIDDLAIALYVDKMIDSAVLKQIEYFSDSKQVKQLVVVHNTESKIDYDFSKNRKIQVLKIESQISQGAALNKMLSHVYTKHVLLIDPFLLGDLNIDLKQLLSFTSPPLSRLFVNLPFLLHEKSPYFSYQKKDYWSSRHLNVISFLLWGAVLFDHQFVLTLGGFDETLCYDDLLVDLSMRAHKQQVMIIEPVIEPLATLYAMIDYQSHDKAILQKYFDTLKPWSSLIIWLKNLSRNTAPSYQKIDKNLPTSGEEVTIIH